MKTKLFSATLIFSLLFCGHVYANDTSVRVGAGGLTFVKSEEIRMVQEILTISQEQIRVQYRFLNETKKDIESTIAFPMPLYTWISGEGANEGPVKSFRVWKDGKSIKTKTLRMAMMGDRDVTQDLKRVGLSDHQIFTSFGEYNGKPFTKKQNAKVAELSGIPHNQPRWQVSETAYWEQVFPSKREFEVEHTYKPFVGWIFTVGNGLEFPTPPDWAKPKPADDEACIDEGTRSAITAKAKRILAEGASAVRITLRDVEYVLGTGRNWKGPISDFRLRIKKTSPEEVISLCFPGKPKKISNSMIEFSQSNFVPQDKLIVHFYLVTPEIEPHL